MLKEAYSQVAEFPESEQHSVAAKILSGSVESVPEDKLPIYSEDGVDLTLIRWMLSLSPVERLRTAQRNANSVQRLRNAPRRI